MASSSSSTSKPLTIGLFSSYYPPHMGGVEQFTRNLAHALARQGHRVVVVSCNTEGCAPVDAEDGLIEVHRLPARDLGGRFPLLLARKGAAHFAAIQEIPFDAVVANTRFYPLSLQAARLAASKGLRPIIIEHGSAHLGIASKPADAVISRYEHAISRALLRYNPVGFGVSAEAAHWMQHFGVEVRGVIHNAIDAQAFRSSASQRNFRDELHLQPGTPLVAFTGRLIPEKGASILLEAAREFERSDSAHFLIAGEGPQLEELVRAAGSNVHLLGRLDRQDVAALLTQADLFCFPSSYPEGMPTSLLEAAACECYLVSTPVAGAREIVPGLEYGSILSEATPASLANALATAFADPDATARKAQACRAHVEQEFSWEASARALLRAISSLQDEG